METQHKRSAFSGKLGFVLSAAGASVGLGNIWRFPYLAAKYGGGIFLLIYILLAVTFGYTMIIAETALGRMTRKSPVGAYSHFGKGKGLAFGGWINAVIPILIVPYYSVIGGWVIHYLAQYLTGHGSALASDGYFSGFISNGLLGRDRVPAVHLYHAGHHLCGCAQRRGARLQGDDAGAGGALGGHCRLLGHTARRTGRCKVFPGAQPGQLLVDDRGFRHGADVLLPLHCHGHPGDLWLLHEKERVH